MQLSYSALVLAALSLECALAQPAHHRHAHKNKRNMAGVDWNDPANYRGVDFTNIHYNMGGQGAQPAANQAPTTTATTVAVTTSADSTPTSAPAAASPASESSPKGQTQSQSSSSSGVQGSFGGMTEPKDDGHKDHYIGNVGIPYGSNMIKLKNVEDATKYKYSNTFHNPTGEGITVIVWNKSGRDGQAQSGMGQEPNLRFNLGPNEKVAVVFDENSQVSFSRDCKRNPDKGNLPDCTWGEADFGDLRNGGWSGYDRSSIPNSAGNTGLLTMSCEGAKTSSQHFNSFTSEAQTNAGGALEPGPAHFFTEIGA